MAIILQLNIDVTYELTDQWLQYAESESEAKDEAAQGAINDNDTAVSAETVAVRIDKADDCSWYADIHLLCAEVVKVECQLGDTLEDIFHQAMAECEAPEAEIIDFNVTSMDSVEM